MERQVRQSQREDLDLRELPERGERDRGEQDADQRAQREQNAADQPDVLRAHQRRGADRDPGDDRGEDECEGVLAHDVRERGLAAPVPGRGAGGHLTRIPGTAPASGASR